MCVCIYIPFAISLKLAQHCKSTILQIKYINKKDFLLNQKDVTAVNG